MAEEYDYLFKCIVVGDGGVGKTALTLRFSKGFFTEDYKMTIGVDFHVKTIKVETEEEPLKAKLQIWDTGGQERFSSIRPMYYRGSLGALLIFDLTSMASFEHLPQWIEEVRANVNSDIPLLLVGNKSDLEDQREVSLEEINSFSDKFNLYYMETSAKTGEGVGDCFYVLACLMIGSGVPDQLIAEGSVYAPGRIITEPKATTEPAQPEPAEAKEPLSVSDPSEISEPTEPVPQFEKTEYDEPEMQTEPQEVSEPSSEPVSEPAFQASESEDLEAEPEFEYEAPDVPEPSFTTTSAESQEIEETSLPSETVEEIEPQPPSDFDYDAPPVPEPPQPSQSQSIQELQKTESDQEEVSSEPQGMEQVPGPEGPDDFEFKTPDQILSEEAEEKGPQLFSSEINESEGETYKPKTIPFTSNAPEPTSPPEEFQKPPREMAQVEEKKDMIPFLGSESKSSKSSSLFDYLPKTYESEETKKKKKKKKKKKSKKKEKVEEVEKVEDTEPHPFVAFQRVSQQGTSSNEDEASNQQPLFRALGRKTQKSEQTDKNSSFLFRDSEESPQEESHTEPASNLRIIPNVEDVEPQSSEVNTPTSQPQSKRKSKETDVVICSHCGAMLSSDYAFCNKCGAKL
jgi:small GTP-binding protein